MAEGGFPHSEILGSKLVRSSPRLIAAYHVLHRLSAPRHPPDALKALDRSHDRCPVVIESLLGFEHRPSTVTIKTGSRLFRPRCLMLAERTRTGRFRVGPGTFPLHDVRYPQPPATALVSAKLFDPDDPRPRCLQQGRVVELDGIEPTTSCLQSTRSPD